MRRTVLVVLGVLAVAVVGLFQYRFDLVVAALSSDGPPPLRDKQQLAASERWFDDYYTIDRIDERTHVIGEPRASGPVFNYLLEGRDRAILFDLGYPSADILPVVKSITDKPVLAIPSHLHFDHVGNLDRFDNIALLDTPDRRAQTEENVFTPSHYQYLGSTEGHEIPNWKVTRWLSEGEVIDLGDRQLKVIFTPGHTDECISLWDETNKQLFTGDYIYEGPLFAFLPNSSLASYIDVAEKLLMTMPMDTQLFTAHRTVMTGTPVLGMQDIVDLRNSLEAIRSGDASPMDFYPARFSINERMEIWTDLPWAQDWTK
eukprot:s1_g2509.t1